MINGRADGPRKNEKRLLDLLSAHRDVAVSLDARLIIILADHLSARQYLGMRRSQKQ